jgi:hypothetical protein
MKTSSWSLEHSAVSAQLKRFIAEKLAQVRSEIRAIGHEMSPEFKFLFAAAEKGDWRGATNSLAAIRRSWQQQGESSGSKSCAVYPVEWSAALEIAGALEEFATGEEKYAAAFATDIIASIPPGSVYFGGTDAGRFLVTALSKSHVNADPFFTLTQNALADRSYLRYARSMYENRIYVPTAADSANAFSQYLEDAQRRQKENKLRPGECLEEVEGKMQISGAISVMAINAALSKLMFDKNPELEFYVEESFPLDWMYPHLSPHGLILKINRQPLSELSNAVVEGDREYWKRYIDPMIGDWLSYDTSVSEIVAFVEKVHVNHDLTGFKGDLRYIQNDMPQRNFSKLRSSIGGVYTWRAQHSENPADKERMLKEADFAFRQASALCPSSPEAVFRYINLLLGEKLGQKRLDDAILVVQAAVKLEEASSQPAPRAHIQEDFSHEPFVQSEASHPKLLTPLGNLLEQLKKMKAKKN